MTNNPTFDKQLFNLNNYISLSAEAPKNTLASIATILLFFVYFFGRIITISSVKKILKDRFISKRFIARTYCVN